MAGIYIHIPFCKQACYYCNFHFSTHTTHKSPLLAAIGKELTLRRTYLGPDPITSIYLGGGTPSLLTSQEVACLLAHIADQYTLASKLEITLEVNPDDANASTFRAWRELGINRLSMGIQSFQDTLLHALHRAHSRKQALASIQLAREAGFQINLDLMYALPGQSLALWQADLAIAMQLAPEHLAAYCLTIEPRTVFGHWQKQGRLIATPDDVAALYFETLLAVLTDHGYEQYEVSNFCKPPYYAQHNMNYWKQGSYLGVGPSAHSYNGITRQYNVANNAVYIQQLQQGHIPCTQEVLSRQDHINEYIMTRLRTQWGCDLAWLQTQYAYAVQQTRGKYLQLLYTQQLARLQGHTLLLTPKGLLVADQIAADLFVN